MADTNSLLIDVKEVSKGLKKLDGALTPKVFDLTSDDRFRCAQPLDYALQASFVGEGILLEGRASTTVHCTCDRCLKEYDLEVVVPDVCHFYEEIDRDTIDVTDDVREDVVINFPDKCLCDDDCLGICPQCGKNLNEESCECSGPPDAPGVWDSLDGLDV